MLVYYGGYPLVLFGSLKWDSMYWRGAGVDRAMWKRLGMPVLEHGKRQRGTLGLVVLVC